MKKAKNNCEKSKLFSFKYILYDFIRITAAIPGFIWFRPKIVYENEAAAKKIRGGALMIANHTGFYDPVYLMIGIWRRRHHFIAAKELFKSSKFSGFLFKYAFMCISIDRENFSLATFREITGRLKRGELLTMFPEGHIGRASDEMQSFKSGMVLMAAKSDKPIIPVYVKRKEKWYSRLVFAVGEPVNVKELLKKDSAGKQDMEAVTAYLYEKEKELEALVSE